MKSEVIPSDTEVKTFYEWSWGEYINVIPFRSICRYHLTPKILTLYLIDGKNQDFNGEKHNIQEIVFWYKQWLAKAL